MAFDRTRSFVHPSGASFLLRTRRDVDGDGWLISLWLYRKLSRVGKIRVEHRDLRKSGSWSTGAIELVQAQEELQLLQDHGFELSILDLA